jgi:hypothetical protein
VEKNMVATKRSSSHDVQLNPKHKGGAAAAGGGSGIASERRESAAAVALIEPLGGFIFVCNNDTMSEDFERHLFGKVLSLSFSSSSLPFPLPSISFGFAFYPAAFCFASWVCVYCVVPLLDQSVTETSSCWMDWIGLIQFSAACFSYSYLPVWIFVIPVGRGDGKCC